MTDEKTEATARHSGEFDTDKPLYRHGGYVEDENHRPNPLWQYGTVRTDGVGGDNVHGNADEISPAFAIGRAETLVRGARALDPDDDLVSPDMVVLPSANNRTDDEARELLRDAARYHLDNPVQVGGMTPARREAALSDEDDADGDVVEGDRDAEARNDEKTPENSGATFSE